MIFSFVVYFEFLPLQSYNGEVFMASFRRCRISLKKMEDCSFFIVLSMLKPPHFSISPYWRIKHQEAYQQCHADEGDPSVKGFYTDASECVRVGYEKIADSLGDVVVETFAINRATPYKPPLCSILLRNTNLTPA